MKFIFQVFLACLLPFIAMTQQMDTTIINQIKAEALGNSQLPQLAQYLTDVCGPRLTNSPGYRNAVNWTVKTFQGWGIKAAPEAWGEYGKGWSNEVATLSIEKPYHETLVAYAMPYSGSTKNLVNTGVIVIDNLDSATIDKAGESLKGKIVIVKSRTTQLPASLNADAYRYSDSDLVKMRDQDVIPPQMVTVMKARLKGQYETKLYLEKKGAVALVSGRGRDGTVFVSAYLGYAKQFGPTLPELVIPAEQSLKLQRLAGTAGLLSLSINVQSKFYTDDLTGYNVIAEIPGTDPKLKNEVVMIGAHLDSWTTATGATDNAAGCVVMMETLRIIQKLGLKPKRTIRVALWGGEEQVILGSVGYVKKHFADPADMKLKAEHKSISAYYNLDNGTGKIRGIYLQGNEGAGKLFSEWFQPFADLGARTVTTKYSGGSDQEAFEGVGIPAFPFIQDPLDYDTRTHHSNIDVYERLSIEDLKQCAAIVASFAYLTAMQTEMIPRKPLPVAGSFPLSNGLVP